MSLVKKKKEKKSIRCLEQDSVTGSYSYIRTITGFMLLCYMIVPFKIDQRVSFS